MRRKIIGQLSSLLYHNKIMNNAKNLLYENVLRAQHVRMVMKRGKSPR